MSTRLIRRVVLHCTDSEWGTVESIRRVHIQERQFTDIGYHRVFTNCYPTYESLHSRRPVPEYDGKDWLGRPVEERGAHAVPWNEDSIGIALVGRAGTFTGLQLLGVVAHCAELVHAYQIPISAIYGHYEVPGTQKTCPDVNMDHFRELVRKRLS